MEEMLPKVRQLRDKYKAIDIQVDGGVNCGNVVKCYEAGANVIVSGSGSKFSSPASCERRKPKGSDRLVEGGGP